MELDQEVRAFFTSDNQVEAKRLNLYVSLPLHSDQSLYVQKNFLKCKVNSCFSK